MLNSYSGTITLKLETVLIQMPHWLVEKIKRNGLIPTNSAILGHQALLPPQAILFMYVLFPIYLMEKVDLGLLSVKVSLSIDWIIVLIYVNI